MRTSWLLSCAACLLLLLHVAGCGDPSTVGAELIGEEGGDPVVVSLPPGFEPDTVRDVTGNASRILAGAVDDPLLGRTEATGYVDFSLSNRPDNFEDSTITEAALRLQPNYVYGDTTATIRLALYEMTEEWDAGGLPADTSLQPIVSSQRVAEYTVAVSDTLVDLPLPQQWLDRRRDVLRDTSFASEFHGFQLRPVSDEAVLGIGTTTALRVETGEATVSYGLARTATTLRRTSPPQLPEGTVLVQDGVGPALEADIAVPDSLRETPLNQFELQLSTNLEALREAPPHFVRPALGGLRLFWAGGDGEPQPVADITLDDLDEGAGQVTFGQPVLRSRVQDALLNDEPIRLLLAAPGPTPGAQTLPNTLNAMLLHTGTLPDGAAAQPSRVVFILTPLDD